MFTLSGAHLPHRRAHLESGDRKAASVQHDRTSPLGELRGWKLWRAWIVTNAVGELIGLAVPAIIGIGVAEGFGSTAGRTAGLVSADAMIVAGALEGAIVGLAQWRVLRRVFSLLDGGQWMGWTALGAAIAWAFGMLPTVMLSEVHTSADVAPMSGLIKYTLAAAMGGVLGAILGISQWHVLRRQVRGAALWVPANALAWMIGMPLIFAVASSVTPGASLPWLALVAGLAFVLTGAIVGAIHGLVLVWFTTPASLNAST